MWSPRSCKIWHVLLHNFNESINTHTKYPFHAAYTAGMRRVIWRIEKLANSILDPYLMVWNKSKIQVFSIRHIEEKRHLILTYKKHLLPLSLLISSFCPFLLSILLTFPLIVFVSSSFLFIVVTIVYIWHQSCCFFIRPFYHGCTTHLSDSRYPHKPDYSVQQQEEDPRRCLKDPPLQQYNWSPWSWRKERCKSWLLFLVQSSPQLWVRRVHRICGLWK